MNLLDNIPKCCYMFSNLFCLLQNKYVFIVKTFKDDYRFSESFGGP